MDTKKRVPKRANINDILDYQTTDIKENINLLNNADLTAKEKEILLNDLPRQVNELRDTINGFCYQLEDLTYNLKDSINNYDPTYPTDRLETFKRFIESELTEGNISDTESVFIIMVLDAMQEMFNKDTINDNLEGVYFEFNKALAQQVQKY